MLSLRDGGWFSPRMVPKIAWEKKKKGKNNCVKDSSEQIVKLLKSLSLVQKANACSWCVQPA